MGNSHLKLKGRFTPEAEAIDAPRNEAHFLSASSLNNGAFNAGREAPRIFDIGSHRLDPGLFLCASRAIRVKQDRKSLVESLVHFS